MSKYHINGEGNPGKCSAETQCPFGSSDEHYATANDARLAFEVTMHKRLKKDWEALRSAESDLKAKETEEEAAKNFYVSAALKSEYWRENVSALEVVKGVFGKSKARQALAEDAESKMGRLRALQTKLSVAESEKAAALNKILRQRKNRDIKLLPVRKLPQYRLSPPPAPPQPRRAVTSSGGHDHRMTHTGHYDSRSSHSSF